MCYGLVVCLRVIFGVSSSCCAKLRCFGICAPVFFRHDSQFVHHVAFSALRVFSQVCLFFCARRLSILLTNRGFRHHKWFTHVASHLMSQPSRLATDSSFMTEKWQSQWRAFWVTDLADHSVVTKAFGEQWIRVGLADHQVLLASTSDPLGFHKSSPSAPEAVPTTGSQNAPYATTLWTTTWNWHKGKTHNDVWTFHHLLGGGVQRPSMSYKYMILGEHRVTNKNKHTSLGVR